MCNETGPSGEQKHLVRAKKIGALRCGADDFVKTFLYMGREGKLCKSKPMEKGSEEKKIGLLSDP